MLAKHYGDIPAAARELNIPTPDLRRLTWSKPKLLEEAELERMGVIARAMSVVIQAVYSDDPRRQMWGCDKLLSSWLARDHPLAPAKRRRGGEVGEFWRRHLSLGRRGRSSDRRARWADPCGSALWRRSSQAAGGD